jgi:hypothetical protein
VIRGTLVVDVSMVVSWVPLITTSQYVLGAVGKDLSSCSQDAHKVHPLKTDPLCHDRSDGSGWDSIFVGA